MTRPSARASSADPTWTPQGPSACASLVHNLAAPLEGDLSMDVEAYLAEDLIRDQSTVSRLHRAVAQALETLMWAQDDNGWYPYQLQHGETVEAIEKISISTNAMILHAMGAAIGEFESVLVPVAHMAHVPADLAATVRRSFLAGCKALFGDLEQTQEDEPLCKSATWGNDDPLSLTWLVELAKSKSLDLGTALSNRIIAVSREAVRKVEENPSKELLGGMQSAKPVPNVFPLLRIIQLNAALGDATSDLASSRLTKLLRAQVHEELSNSTIQDGNFDPAGLIFALEGLLVLNREAVGRALLLRVVDVLHTSGSVASHWRPVRPLTVTSQGLILLPQSIEVANSFIRICSLLDRLSNETLFSQSIDMLRSYADWCELRAVKGQTSRLNGSEFEFFGWQSEYTFADGLVHLWATSQVLLFLGDYASMLEQHAAAALRDVVGLKYDKPGTLSQDRKNEIWTDLLLREPLLNVPARQSDLVYDMVEKGLVTPRLRGSGVASFSILLYGPPGTGKTTFAQNIAEVLGYGFISLSPSDFIRSGEAGVEARARRLFEVLEAQSEVVILFDEIDRLVLDRDSSRYGMQSDMFQFMTPSMLTKINDLRKRARSIFIIATNYAELIDPAIKRPGRIDMQLLLLPPGLAQRKRVISLHLVRQGLKLSDKEVELVAKATPLYAFKELQEFAEVAAIAKLPRLRSEDLASLRKERPSSINLESYRGRFAEDIDRGPTHEFSMLAYLVAETGQTISSVWQKNVLRELVKRMPSELSQPVLTAIGP